MATLQNPVREMQRRLGGISVAELGRRSGCPYQSLAKALGGYTRHLPSSVRDALAGLGVAPDEAEEQYLRWRESLRQPIQEGEAE